MILGMGWNPFPDLVGAGWNKITGWSGDKVLESVQGAFQGFIAMTLRGVAWVMAALGQAISGLDGSGIGAEWYTDEVFAPMQLIGVSLAVLALSWGIVSAAWSRKGWVVLKRMSIQMIKWMFLTFFCLQGTQMLMDLTAEFEAFLVSSASGSETQGLFDAFATLGQTAPEGDTFGGVLLLIISLLMMVVGVGILLVLFVRDAALMLVLLFAPVVALLLLTPHAKAVGKFVNKVISLVLLKFIIMVGLILGSTAILSTTGMGDTFVEVPPPSEPATEIALIEEEVAANQEAFAAAEGEAVGTLIVQLLSGLAVMVMSLVMPGFIASVLPDGVGDTAGQSAVGGGMRRASGAGRTAVAMRQRRQMVKATRRSART